MEKAAETIMFSCLGLLAYAYIGYPILLSLLAKMLGRETRKEDIRPSVAVLIACYNEAQRLEGRIANIRALNYPQDQIKIICGSDGSSDGTDGLFQQLQQQDAGFKGFVFSDRRGKASVLNDLVKEAQSEILVFTDARQEFHPDALRHLLSNFADPSVGTVSGNYSMLKEKGGGDLKGVGIYWNFEKQLRKNEGLLHSSIGATGALYAIRRGDFKAFPADALIDDVTEPLFVNALGKRTLFEEKALVFDCFAESSSAEWRRKVRTLAGNFQLLFGFGKYGNPWRPALAFQYASHKLIRLLIPLILILLFTASCFSTSTFGEGLRNLQILAYAFAGIGYVLEKCNLNFFLFSVPHTFVMLNLAVIAGFFSFITGKSRVLWK